MLEMSKRVSALITSALHNPTIKQDYGLRKRRVLYMSEVHANNRQSLCKSLFFFWSCRFFIIFSVQLHLGSRVPVIG